MAKAKIKTYDEAVAAQVDGKQDIKDAKVALTSYYKENKLKRSDEHEGKHGKRIERLEAAVERAQDNLAKANELAKDLKPPTVRKTKYDYPDDIDTPEKRKKYRQAQRAAKNKKDKPTKKIKKNKKGKKSKKNKSNKDD